MVLLNFSVTTFRRKLSLGVISPVLDGPFVGQQGKLLDLLDVAEEMLIVFVHVSPGKSQNFGVAE